MGSLRKVRPATRSQSNSLQIRALDYAIQVTNSAEATGGSAGVSVGDILNGSTSVFNFSEQVPPYVVHGTSPTASISLHTGVLLPGTYDLIEEVSAGGDIPANGEPPSLITGTSSFDFVLTPVNPAGTPEPSSIAMMSTAFVSCLLAARASACVAEFLWPGRCKRQCRSSRFKSPR